MCWCRRRPRPKPFRIGERADDPLAMYKADLCTLPSSLYGGPAISVPVGLGRRGLAGRTSGDGSGHGRRPRVPSGRGAGSSDGSAVGRRRCSRKRWRCEHLDADAVLTYDADDGDSFDPVLGLEVHVELGHGLEDVLRLPDGVRCRRPTRRCVPPAWDCRARLPVLNARLLSRRSASAWRCNCQVAPWCRFARKNYFYPDMPKNFQTSQYDEPICFDGYLDVDVETDEGTRTFRVEIERAHMEEDTGKSLHVGGSTGRIHGADFSLVDYNRAGIPLIEIVTKPLAGAGRYAPEVARAYVGALRESAALRSMSLTSRWSRARCAAMRTCRCVPLPSRRWARAPRLRTSTRCDRSSVRCATR